MALWFCQEDFALDNRKNRRPEARIRSRKLPAGKNARGARPEKKRHGVHKFFVNTVFLLLIVYLSGYMLAFAFKPTVAVETVAYGSIDTPNAISGIIVRDEQLVKATRDGELSYACGNGERVKKGAAVCAVKDADAANVIEEKIEDIDRSILERQKARGDVSVFREDVRMIEDSIEESVNSYTSGFAGGDLSSLYTMKNDINGRIELRNSIWLTENVQSLEELSNEKLRYESQLTENMETLSSPKSGIVSLYYDGLEEELTVDNLAGVAKERTQSGITPTVISKSGTVEAGSPVFKIIGSNKWYIIAYADDELTQGWEAGNSKSLITYGTSEEKTIDAVIAEITHENGESRVVFESTKGIADFLDYRTIRFKVSDNVYRGLKIPNAAITEKSLLKIPVDCLRESGGSDGVLKVNGEETIFAPVTILRTTTDENGEFACIEQVAGGVKIGDTIISRDGGEGSRYTLSEVVTFGGVYVVNSAVARFTTVDVLIKNNDYAIVSPGSSGYGLQVYDNIVSDAKSVEESDFIS